MVNVFGFGAVGDGVADETAALQHAIDSGDGVLRLNKGTYRITRSACSSIAVTCIRSSFTICHISWNKVAGIKSLGGDVHNLQIVGNDIEYNNMTAGGAKTPLPDGHPGGSEIWFDATDGVISEVTISGNTIQATVQPGGANIRIVGAEVQRPQTADAPQNQKTDTAHLINITGNVLGGATEKLIDASGDRSEVRDNLPLRQGI